MAKKKQHGGKRKGAGRRPAYGDDRTLPVTASVPSELVERLDGLAKREGWNRSKAVTEAIRGLLDARDGRR